jgi:uncharacterized membrane protein YfcA
MFNEPWQLALAILGALLIGLSKTGVTGLGILVAAIFANLMPAKLSSGFVLPMLILGDLMAVYAYRGHADYRQALRLFPWTIPGIVLGYLAFGVVNDRQARLMIGIIVALMVVWHLVRKFGPKKETPTAGDHHSTLEVALLGISAGFTTLIANAAGPIMTLYLLAMGMPKMAFVGTAAVFFCGLNLLKVPFMVSLGSIQGGSLGWNLALAPAVLLGAWLGRKLLGRMSQKWFEYIALTLSAAAAVKLLS